MYVTYLKDLKTTKHLLLKCSTCSYQIIHFACSVADVFYQVGHQRYYYFLTLEELMTIEIWEYLAKLMLLLQLKALLDPTAGPCVQISHANRA